MKLTKEKKSIILDELRDRLENAKIFVIAEYQGTKVVDMEKMRKAFYKTGLKFQIAKNTLFKKALEEKNINIPEEIFDKPITICWGFDDEVEPAKQTLQFSKEFESIKPIGIILESKFYGSEQVKALAELPGKEMLLTKLVSTLNAPIANFVYVLEANISGLVNALNQIKNQKN